MQQTLSPREEFIPGLQEEACEPEGAEHLRAAPAGGGAGCIGEGGMGAGGGGGRVGGVGGVGESENASAADTVSVSSSTLSVSSGALSVSGSSSSSRLAGERAAQQVLRTRSLLALLVQKYRY